MKVKVTKTIDILDVPRYIATSLKETAEYSKSLPENIMDTAYSVQNIMYTNDLAIEEGISSLEQLREQLYNIEESLLDAVAIFNGLLETDQNQRDSGEVDDG